MFEKILVAIDDIESNRSIFDRALMLAKTNRSTLMLLQVLTIVDDFYPGDAFVGISTSAMEVYAKHLETRKQAGIEKLRALAADAIAAGVGAEFTQTIGEPGKVICEVAQSWNADLIVIGRRGLSGLREFLLGSTSSYVLHHATCNVLIIQGSELAAPQLTTEQTLATAT